MTAGLLVLIRLHMQRLIFLGYAKGRTATWNGCLEIPRADLIQARYYRERAR
jgi:hypothetical protein